LALLSVAGGWIGIPEVLGGHNMLHHYFEPVFQMPAAAAEFWASHGGEHSHALELGLMATSVGLAALAALVSFSMYRNGPSKKAAEIAAQFQRPYQLLLNKYFVDEFYFSRIVKPVKEMSEFLYKIVDVKIVDGLVNAVGQFMVLTGGTASFKMTGSMHRYGMVFIIGIICLLSIVVF
jgi:NADH-quinone oxidoreductase subunit L